jgi:hypothetical protein
VMCGLLRACSVPGMIVSVSDELYLKVRGGEVRKSAQLDYWGEVGNSAQLSEAA